MDKHLAHSLRNKILRPSTVVAFIFLLCCCPGGLRGQELTYGMDPALDSVAFARFRTRMDSIRQHRPTVALVLSGGGAKGAAHIAVLQHLDSIGLRPDLIVGTSIGGLVGGLYSCGHNGKELEKLFLAQSWDTLLRDLISTRYDALAQKDFDARCQISLPFGQLNRDFFAQRGRERNFRRNILVSGAVQGQNVSNLLGSLIIGHADECNFLDLPIPFVCVATDMVSARPKIWHSGSLAVAMRSTMSIPGLFSPVKTNDMVLLDGSMRSNFPVEVARTLGADTVIGVDISAPSLQAYEMNTLVDIIAQTTDVLGRETYDAAVRNTDIYIRPDLREFSLLSFNEADIRSMIQRGRTAVGQAAPRLATLNADYRQPDTGQFSIPNSQLSTLDTIPIAAVSFIGIDNKAKTYLLHLLNLGDRVTVGDVEDAVDVMMGTKAFGMVTYQFMGPRPPYILQFTCQPSAVNTLGVGVRFDTPEMGAILLQVGFNTHSLTGSRALIEGRLGQRSLLKATYGFRSRDGLGFGVSASTEHIRHGSFSWEEYDYQTSFRHNRGETFLDVSSWKKYNLRAGVLIDHWHLYSFLSDNSLPGMGLDSLGHDNAYLALFAQSRSDTYDDPYFPTKGLRSDLQARFFFPAFIMPTPFFYTLSGNIGAALSTGRFTFQPYAAARYVSITSAPYMNALSVTASSCIFEHQIPFIGLGDAVICQRLVSTAGLSLRMNVTGKHYLALLGQALHQSDELYSHFLADRSSSALGLGIEYAYRSPVGPLRLIGHWSTFDHKFGLLLNLGVDF